MATETLDISPFGPTTLLRTGLFLSLLALAPTAAPAAKCDCEIEINPGSRIRYTTTPVVLGTTAYPEIRVRNISNKDCDFWFEVHPQSVAQAPEITANNPPNQIHIPANDKVHFQQTGGDYVLELQSVLPTPEARESEEMDYHAFNDNGRHCRATNRICALPTTETTTYDSVVVDNSGDVDGDGITEQGARFRVAVEPVATDMNDRRVYERRVSWSNQCYDQMELHNSGGLHTTTIAAEFGGSQSNWDLGQEVGAGQNEFFDFLAVNSATLQAYVNARDEALNVSQVDVFPCTLTSRIQMSMGCTDVNLSKSEEYGQEFDLLYTIDMVDTDNDGTKDTTSLQFSRNGVAMTAPLVGVYGF